MAVTLAHLAKIETESLKKAVLINLLRWMKVTEILPFENVDALTTIAVRWQTLPDVANRAINQGYTASEGDTEQVYESVYAFGGDINFDRVFEKVKNTIKPMKQLQIEMKLAAMALHFNNLFINGDHASDPLGLEGLKKRIDSYPSRQTVYFATSSGAGLDPTASVANGRAFFDKAEELCYVTNSGQVGALFMNEKLMYGFGRVARYIQASGGNFLDVTKDSFERVIPTFKGARMIDMGLKKDQFTEIITNTEAGGDSTANTTSIYAASFNMEQGITGIQLSDLEQYDPLNGGEQESLPAKLYRLEWWCGLAGFGSYGVARGRNLKGANGWT